MIIMKFGGTSVEDARAMQNVMEIVSGERHRKPVVVLSAIAGATNSLLRSARKALDGDLEKAHGELNALLERHVLLLENLIGNRSDVQHLILIIRKRFDELKTLCQEIAILMEIARNKPEGFSLLSGDDAMTLPLMALGGDRCISVVANEIPKKLSDLVRHCLKGQWEKARLVTISYSH